MDNIKNDEYYLEKLLKDMSFIVDHMDGVSAESLEDNELLLDSMLFRLIQISENSKKLSDSYKLRHKNIPWTDISGLRNRIVHDYGNVNLGIVHATLTDDIPWLMAELEKD